MSIPFRLLTYNLHASVGEDGVRDMERIAKVIQSLNPDLVALQEIDRFVERSGCVDQFEFYRQALRMEGGFAKGIDLEGGEYGIALFSRWKPRHIWSEPLVRESEHEDRVMMGIELEVAGRKLSFVGTHLARYSASLRLKQIQQISAFLQDKQNVFVGGDFNATPEEAPLQYFERRWRRISASAPTRPARAPDVCIDHLFHHESMAIRVCQAEVIPEAIASDHRPSLVEVLWD